MDDIITRGPFMGCEKEAEEGETQLGVTLGLGLGCNPGLSFYKEMLNLYAILYFINPNGSYNQKTIVTYRTETLCAHGLKNTNQIQERANIWIFPPEYFSPKSYKNGQIKKLLILIVSVILLVVGCQIRRKSINLFLIY